MDCMDGWYGYGSNLDLTYQLSTPANQTSFIHRRRHYLPTIGEKVCFFSFFSGSDLQCGILSCLVLWRREVLDGWLEVGLIWSGMIGGYDR